MMEEISHFLNSVCVVLFDLIPLVDEATYALPTIYYIFFASVLVCNGDVAENFPVSAIVCAL